MKSSALRWFTITIELVTVLLPFRLAAQQRSALANGQITVKKHLPSPHFLVQPRFRQSQIAKHGIW